MEGSWLFIHSKWRSKYLLIFFKESQSYLASQYAPVICLPTKAVGDRYLKLYSGSTPASGFISKTPKSIQKRCLYLHSSINRIADHGQLSSLPTEPVSGCLDKAAVHAINCLLICSELFSLDGRSIMVPGKEITCRMFTPEASQPSWKECCGVAKNGAA